MRIDSADDALAQIFHQNINSVSHNTNGVFCQED
ncbi:hypothetical protein NIES298_43470 [Microcystis aeruginosa NIES-298]|nr:hypothetical protein NIES298_43470 [Microcystis aeruginosa NIES-298]